MFSLRSNRFANLHGWRHHGLVFLLGALTSLALPPANFWPMIFITIPIFISILDDRALMNSLPITRFKAGFASGWWLAFGYFVTSLYWIGASMLVEADKFAIFIPLAVLALPAGLAIFWGLAVGLCLMVWQKGPLRIVVLASFLAGFEWLRGHVFTGFPWNTIGYISDGFEGINQLASIIGVYGLSFLIILWAGIPVCFTEKKSTWVFGLALTLTLISSVLWGMQRESQALVSHKETTLKKPVIIRIVQANIAQIQKWDPQYKQANINLYFSLSQAKNNGLSLSNVDILVWPESALPLLYQESLDVQNRINAILPKRTLLIMGALRRDLTKRDAKGRSYAYNSVLAINNNGQTLASYDKSHLVPFGEYLPGEKILAPLGIRKIVDVPYGFNAGPGASTISISGYPPFSSMICYEIIFPRDVIDAKNRPKWIVNVTNDAWFGNTAGPYQHLVQARFRAIETGLPVVRAANTGISALIGPYGDVSSQLKLGQQGVLDVVLPEPIAETLYSRYGDGPFFLLLFCILIVLGLTKAQISSKV